MIREPEWVEYDVVLAIHEAQLAEHGGLGGIRDTNMLHSALARPQHLFTYAPHETIRLLAATYAVGPARNHAFVDGNKRTAWVVAAVFLELNGVSVIADQAEVVHVMVSVASGTMTEAEFVKWLERDDVTANAETA